MANDLTTSGKAGGLPPEISTCLGYEPNRALYELQQRGISAEALGDAAEAVAVTLWPITRNRMIDRLTALGMMLAPNRAPAEASVWVAEMSRLLGHLPEDILNDAIDRCLVSNRFLPTVAEILDHAQPRFDRRYYQHRSISDLAKLAATGVVIRKVDPPEPEPQRPLKHTVKLPRQEPRKPTRQDYLDAGVSPEILDAIAAERA